ncbi:MAG: S8 family serine peptidase [Planctomycetota bacterium]|jgi:subtilisin family serine protease
MILDRKWTAAASLALAAVTGQAMADFVFGQVLVELEDDTLIDDIVAEYGGVVLGAVPTEEVYLVEVPEGQNEQDFADQLMEDPRVDEVDLNDDAEAPGGSSQSFFFSVLPALYDKQYAWPTIQLPDAQLATTGAGVRVAVIDSGVDPAHPALAGVQLEMHVENNFLEPGQLPVEAGNGIDDDGDGAVDEMLGHGTFMTGLIAYMAPDATIVPIRVMTDEGFSSAFSLALAIYRAVDVEQADVINLSLVVDEANGILESALLHARAMGVTVVAAAGNLTNGGEDEEETSVFPASDPNVIGVASTDASDVLGDYSTFGQHVSLTAPGSEVISTVTNEDFASASGTSLSCALVTGAVTLMKASVPTLLPADIEAALAASAVDIDPLNPDFAGQLGAGRLDVAAAIDVANLAPGDLNADGQVNVDDLLALITAWGDCPEESTSCPADLDHSGSVGADDLIILVMNWSS